MKTIAEGTPAQRITRQEAIKKAGKYAAFTAAAAVILLAPRSVQAQGSLGFKSGFGGRRYSPPPGGGGGKKSSPFTKPEPKSNPSGLKDSPWK